MPRCAAVGCKNKCENCKGKNISFHSLPKEKNIRKQWINALHRMELPKDVFVCSEHFEESCFDPSVKLQNELLSCEKPLKTKLILGSVPTKFSHKSATTPRTSSINREKKKEMRKAVEEAINESSSSNTESTFKDAFTQISVVKPKTATKGTNARCKTRCRQTQTIKARKTLSIHHCKHIDEDVNQIPIECDIKASSIHDDMIEDEELDIIEEDIPASSPFIIDESISNSSVDNSLQNIELTLNNVKNAMSSNSWTIAFCESLQERLKKMNYKKQQRAISQIESILYELESS